MARSERGFTLLELLLLLLIVGLLAAVLYPVFAQAAQAAREKTCLSNLNQLAQAVLMYAHDWDGCAPGVSHPWAALDWLGGWPRNENVFWAVNLGPYVKNRSSYSCPNAQKNEFPYQVRPGEWDIMGIPIPASWQDLKINYGFNSMLQLSTRVPNSSDYAGGQLDPSFPNNWFNWEGMRDHVITPQSGWGGRNLSRLSRPLEVVLVAESSHIGQTCFDNINFPDVCGNAFSPCGYSQATPAYARHNGGNNWAFADGHAKWVRAGAFACVVPSATPQWPWIATDGEILSANSLQKVIGLDQLN